MIIERYLYREVLRTGAAVFAVLVLVYGADRFTRFLSDAAAGAVPPELVVQILALKLAEEVPMLLSLALYLAVLLSLGRLYKYSEIVAFGAAGVGLGRLSPGVFRVVAAFSLAGAALSLFVSPSLASMRGALLEKARHRAESQVFVPGRFKEFGTGDQVIYVEAMDYESGEMSNVFVRVRTPNRQYVLTSHAAHQVVRPASGARYMVLENGYRYAGLPWDAKLSVTPGLPSVPEGPLKRINFSSPHLLGLWRTFVRPTVALARLALGRLPFRLLSPGFQPCRLLLGFRDLPLASFVTVVRLSGHYTLSAMFGWSGHSPPRQGASRRERGSRQTSCRPGRARPRRKPSALRST